MSIESKRVEEIMVPLARYPHVPETATIKEAMAAMLRCQLNVGGQKSLPRAVLVLDLMGRLAGQVRRRDLMRGLEPEFMVSHELTHRKKLFEIKPDQNLSELFFDKTVKGIRERARRKVSEVMLPVTVTIKHDAHILTAISEMVENNLSLLPVVKGEQAVGVVRSVDVFRELSHLVFEPEELGADEC